MNADNAELGMDLGLSAVHLIHRASQAAGEIFSELVGSAGITQRQFAVLVTVAEHEGLSQTGLVEKTGIDRSTLADIIKRMAQRGLIKRSRTRHDARAYAVKLSDHGRKVLEETLPAVKKVEKGLLSSLTDSEQKQLIDYLGKLVSKPKSE